jgi:GT2 family glycosyltransferase
MKDLSIVLVNYYFKQDILQALLSLTQDISECPYDIQITVVDNSGNADGIGKALHEQFPQVTYINAQKNLGFGQGTTLGFKAHTARYYFALNPDTFIPAQSRVIERLIKFMDDHPKIGCIGPKLVNMDGSIQPSCFRFDPASIFVKPFKQINWDKKYRLIKRLTSRLSMDDFSHDRTQPVDWVLGAALMVRHEVVAAIGWFDERYFMYLEDCDWCRTMWEAGWSVYYVHDIVIKHRYTRQSAKVPGLFKALVRNRLARIHLKSWLKYMWKWRGQWKFPERST